MIRLMQLKLWERTLLEEGTAGAKARGHTGAAQSRSISRRSITDEGRDCTMKGLEYYLKILIPLF